MLTLSILAVVVAALLGRITAKMGTTDGRIYPKSEWN